MRFNNSAHIINVTWSERGLSKYRRTTEKKPLKVLSIQMYTLGLVVNAFMWVATHLVDTTNLGVCIKNLVDSSSYSINAKRVIKWLLELCEKTVFFSFHSQLHWMRHCSALSRHIFAYWKLVMAVLFSLSIMILFLPFCEAFLLRQFNQW